MIEIKNVTKSFGEKIAVKNLALSIATGEVFGFLGPNGAGKTTTMKMILGLLRPTEGEITILGEHAGTIAARRKLGFLPEFANFYQHLTGREFLEFVGEIFSLSPSEITKRSRNLLKLVNLPAEAHDRQVRTYSKGMQQRIGLAQALMNDPDILFLDEPMSGLDPIGRREIKDIILTLKHAGKTVFFNSHILADAEEICDSVGIIHLGKLLVLGKVKDVIPKGKNLEDVFVETITGVGNKEQGTKNKEQGTKSKEQGTGNKEQGTGNKEQRTGNKEQRTGNKKQPVSFFPPDKGGSRGVKNKKQGTKNRKQGTKNKKQESENKEQTGIKTRAKSPSRKKSDNL